MATRQLRSLAAVGVFGDFIPPNMAEVVRGCESLNENPAELEGAGTGFL
jgi:hypothetical protein